MFLKLSKPKLNHSSQLNSTEFEVRLHSYSDIHHHHHPPPHQELSVLLLLLTAQPAAGRDCTVTHRSVELCISERLTLFFSKLKDFGNFCLRIKKYSKHGRKGYSLDPGQIWCNFFSKSLCKVKSKVVGEFRYLFYVCSCSTYLSV